MRYDVIIIGAGAAGLAAMKELLDKGYRVCMLEASSIPGGRIATITEDGFDMPVEAGAEFVHGKLPLTFKILNEAGIGHETIEGSMIGVKDGKRREDEHDPHWDEFMSKLHHLKKDITILEFINENFSDNKYQNLRTDVQRFAEGFNLADISKASIIAIKDEWKGVEKKQYRVRGGYTQLINYLLDACLEKNGFIYYNTCAAKIEHGKKLIIHTVDKRKFEADRVIVTVSVGVLQSGVIQFEPALNEHATAIQSLGFGGVIKFLFQFKKNFWNEYHDDIGFILSNEEIPTWWTQLPTKSNLLTGWLGGPKAIEKVFESEKNLLQPGLQSLSSIFQIPVVTLHSQLESYKIINWQNNPFVIGGYSFNTLGTEKAKEVLVTPVNNMVYFAGEAVGQGDSQGTVESALQSGIDAAALIIQEDKK